jgi:ADP-heptose:LPS heptosyltransferase
LDSFLAQKAIYANRGRRDYLHFMSGLSYSTDAIDIQATEAARLRLGLDKCPYVTVHNGYDPNMVVSHARATKCYPHFGQVIAMLRASHPDVTFVQIGIHTSQPIEEADLNLIGRTSLPEAAGLIRGALFHMDNEGGLVHLAAAMGRPSCVVFGPTSSRYFGYPTNINVDPNFCGGCWWVNATWMNHCPRGFATARCMTEQPATIVARAAEALLPLRRFAATQRTTEHHGSTQTVG